MHRLNRVLAALAAAAFTLLGTSAWAQNEEAEQKAVAAATSWLALVDAGKYAESWDAASAFFKSAVSRERWVEMLNASRKPLGKVDSRTLAMKQHLTEMPNAPKGEYVVIAYKTVFENMPRAIETVTPMLEKDESWRVSGYYIKPPAP